MTRAEMIAWLTLHGWGSIKTDSGFIDLYSFERDSTLFKVWSGHDYGAVSTSGRFGEPIEWSNMSNDDMAMYIEHLQ